MAREREQCVQALTVKTRTRAGLGSGMFIDERGSIATCAHCLGRSHKGEFSSLAGVGSFVVSSRNDQDDLAILKSDANRRGKDFVRMLSQTRQLEFRGTPLVDGETITICGYPYIYSPKARERWHPDIPLRASGTVSLSTDDEIFISCMTHHGNSGGPCFDDDGKIIGVVKEILRIGQGVKADIPSGYGVVVPVSKLLKIAGNFRQG